MLKKFSLFLLFVLILYNHQDLLSQTSQDSIKNSLKKGSWSLQFQISSNFTLNSFQGSNISAKKHLSSNSAMRFGVGLYGYTSDRDLKINQDNDYDKSRNSQLDDDVIDIAINCYYLYYAHPERKINMYGGCGPFFGVQKYDDEVNDQEVWQDSSNIMSSTEEDYQNISFGVLGLIGVEWFLNQQISIHAEYGSSLSYEIIEVKDTKISSTLENYKEKFTRKDEANRITFRSSRVMFGVSAYF